jgi:hypothetical protein
VRYCNLMQVAVGDDGRPLIERWEEEDDQAKKWTSKDTTNGDEGPEESVWEREEQ